MKTIMVIIAVCALGFLTSLVMGQERQNLPSGVVEENWISIGDNVGFVITPNKGSKSSATLNGYFMARRGNSWMRLDLEEGGKYYPLQR